MSDVGETYDFGAEMDAKYGEGFAVEFGFVYYPGDSGDYGYGWGLAKPTFDDGNGASGAGVPTGAGWERGDGGGVGFARCGGQRDAGHG